MSYLTNLNKLSLLNTKTALNSVVINCTKKTFSIPCQLNLKSSYHLNTSNLKISNDISSEKLSFNKCSIKNYARQCCINSQITDNEYHELADEFFDNLSERIEIILERSSNENYDTELASGVLTINLGKAGTYVINKQSANRQIWYSSPISGPCKFIYDTKTKRWVQLNLCDSEDESRFIEVKLAKELSQILKKPVEIPKMNED